MGVHFDTSQVDRLAVDMAGAPMRLQMKARGVMKRGALEIKKNLRREFSGHSHAGGVPFSLEMEPRGQFGWEIGELDSGGRQWGIAAILEYGTVNNSPRTDMKASLRKEIPAIMRHLGDEAAAAVFGRREYTTKSGRTIMATEKQIANWTRGSRS